MGTISNRDAAAKGMMGAAVLEDDDPIPTRRERMGSVVRLREEEVRAAASSTPSAFVGHAGEVHHVMSRPGDRDVADTLVLYESIERALAATDRDGSVVEHGGHRFAVGMVGEKVAVRELESGETQTAEDAWAAVDLLMPWKPMPPETSPCPA